MKLTIISEPLSNANRSEMRRFTAEVSEVEAEALVTRDLEIRSRTANDSSAVKPRTAQEILTEIGKNEYNGWHSLWRQDRRKNRLCSFENWNAYGNRDEHCSPAIDDELVKTQEHIEYLRKLQIVCGLLNEFISDLPETQKSVFVEIMVNNRPAQQVAKSRGVSKAAVSKALSNAKKSYSCVFRRKRG
ncbi:hypothetical protein [Timonella sp. A28]|uniref:hypothetical protein n=1 Tax=Timonella sp. A28 TaxID=3442640 RepID=UPI003EC02F15